MPINVSREKDILPISKMVAPAIMGTDNKKVNLVAALFDRPNNLADKIVVPLRENPGIMAKACDNPIIIDWDKVICLKSVSMR